MEESGKNEQEKKEAEKNMKQEYEQKLQELKSQVEQKENNSKISDIKNK